MEKKQNNCYQLTFKVMDLALMVLIHFKIRQEALPFMLELSTKFKEMVNLGFRNGKGIFCLDKIDSTEILRIDASLGSNAPANKLGWSLMGALEKLLLAFPMTLDLSLQLNRMTNDIVEICEMTSTKHTSHLDSAQITLCDLAGTGVQDTAIANLALKTVDKLDLNTEIDMGLD